MFKSTEDCKAAIGEEAVVFSIALKTLSELLKKHHGNNVIILLDEYDVSLEHAWQAGFYPEMISFIRSLFESALKTNDALEFAVITGCMSISRESILIGFLYRIHGKAFRETGREINLCDDCFLQLLSIMH